MSRFHLITNWVLQGLLKMWLKRNFEFQTIDCIDIIRTINKCKNKEFFVLPHIWQLQGVSHWNVSFKLTLTDRNRQARNCWKVILTFWDYEIWVFQPVFLKSYIFWPHQPPTEIVSDTSENLDFSWLIPQKRAIVGHFGTRGDQIIKNRKFFE